MKNFIQKFFELIGIIVHPFLMERKKRAIKMVSYSWSNDDKDVRRTHTYEKPLIEYVGSVLKTFCNLGCTGIVVDRWGRKIEAYSNRGFIRKGKYVLVVDIWGTTGLVVIEILDPLPHLLT
ncbi:MAG: hypothetical protein SF052_20800 [Bacteroidia bacterium]|nr:hypothetical protein [Bacteroidia bacterium]